MFSQPAPIHMETGERVESIRDKEEEDKVAKAWADREIARKKGEALAEEVHQKQRKLIFRKASSYTPKNPRWLWAPGKEQFGRIPLGKLTLLVGKGGVGKTTLECTWCAWITTGRMEGEFHGTPKNVLWVVYEDDIEDTIVPRLMSAGADLDRISFVTMEELGAEGRVLLPTDCESIEKRVAEDDAVVLMVDPLSGALRVDNTNDAKKVRAAVEAVQAMCLRAGISCIGVAHTRKAISHNLMDAILGSSEMGNVCRAAIGLIEDPDVPNTVVLSQEKNNGGRLDIYGYRYKIEQHVFYAGERFIRSSRLEFLEKVEPNKVSNILSDQAAGGIVSKSALEEAKDFIYQYLVDKGGVAPRGETILAAQRDGHSRSTIERSAKIMKLTSTPSGRGASRMWSLPQSPQSPQ